MPAHYKSRAAAVRAAAKSRLSELRSARLARHPGRQKPPNRENEAAFLNVSSEFHEQRNGALQSRENGSEFEVSNIAGEIASDVRVESTDLSENAVFQISCSKESDELGDAGFNNHQKTFNIEKPKFDIIDRSNCNFTNTSVDVLPGVGPGIVWALKNAGVFSTHDLAESEPEQLSARLGLVGELLDLASWIAEAKKLSEYDRIATKNSIK